MKIIPPAGSKSAMPTVSTKEIRSAAAACGGGKTNKTVEVAVPQVLAGVCFIYAGPTMELTKEFLRKLRTKLHECETAGKWAALRSRTVNTDDVADADIDGISTSVSEILAKEIANTPKGRGRVLCITHAALALVRPGTIPDDWKLVIDEAITSVC